MSPRESPDGNCGPRVMMPCQCPLTDAVKCPLPVGGVEGGGFACGEGGIWEIS